jgi:hypothetical protein
VTAPVSVWNFDMSAAPRSRKVLALNAYGGCAVFAVLSAHNLAHFCAWAPLPKIPPERKKRQV